MKTIFCKRSFLNSVVLCILDAVYISVVYIFKWYIKLLLYLKTLLNFESKVDVKSVNHRWILLEYAYKIESLMINCL